MPHKYASKLIQIDEDNYLITLRRCNGYYECLKAQNGRRLGPLVGYAGKYDDGTGAMKQWVGDVYYNFARIEEYHHALDYFGRRLADMIAVREPVLPDYIIGAPLGGLAIAQAVARHLDRRYVFFEKKVLAVANEHEREKSVLVWGRHEMERGSTGILVEDVCNNFSTTAAAAMLVAGGNSRIIGVACEMNRSPVALWSGMPVHALLHIPTAQYRQDDPFVADDIAEGNVVWKPKDEWVKLTRRT